MFYDALCVVVLFVDVSDFGLHGWQFFSRFFQRYSHLVERAPHEDDSDNEDGDSDVGGVVHATTFFRVYRHLDRDFGREQTKQRRELDDGVHGYG